MMRPAPSRSSPTARRWRSAIRSLRPRTSIPCRKRRCAFSCRTGSIC
jgi:hypothetical protein